GLDDRDRAHSEVKRRLSASKLAVLADPIATTKNNAAKTAAALVEAFGGRALSYVANGAKSVAVIVNRVALAGQIHAALEQRVSSTADVVLLTGRMRPLDRDAVLGDASDPRSVAGRVMSGRPREPDQRPVIIVSTQTIEAGADMDFDALVTE